MYVEPVIFVLDEASSEPPGGAVRGSSPSNSELQFGPTRRMLDVHADEAAGLIEALRRFLGHDQIEESIGTYKLQAQRRGPIFQFQQRERQPLLEGFDVYDKATLRGRRPPRDWADDWIAGLVHVAANFYVISRTLTPGVANAHRASLLDLSGRHRDVLLEWVTASNTAVSNGADAIAWTPTGVSGPDFLAKAGSLVWEVECKRLSTMVLDLFGEDESETLADRILDAIEERGLQGSVHLEIPDGIFLGAFAGDNFGEAIEALSGAGADEVRLPSGGKLSSGSLRPKADEAIELSAWKEAVADLKTKGGRVYAAAKAVGPRASNPITVSIGAPRRSAEQFVQYVWERRFNKAAIQCSGERGGVVVVEWEGITDASIFRDSPPIQELIRRTFSEHPHIAAMAMRCASAPTKENGATNFSVPGYLVKSAVTKYPEIAAHVKME